MARKDKFLAIGVELKKIIPASMEYALHHQRQGRLNKENKLVGDILVAAKLLTEAGRSEILREQQRRRAGRFHFLRRLIPGLPSLPGQRLLVIVAALFGAVAAYRSDMPLESVALGVGGLVTLALLTFIEYGARRSITLAAIYAAVIWGGLFVLISIVYSVHMFTQLNVIVDPHTNPGTRASVGTWLFQIKGAILALAVATITLGVYSLWKFHALRYTQARVGLLKDTIIRVEGTLRDKSKRSKERQDEAITTVLKGLRDAIRLSLPDRALRRLTLFFHGRDQITVMYFIPEPDSRRFRLDKVEYPEDAPAKVRAGFTWMQHNHFPTFLDEEGFEKMVKLAKGLKPRGWRRRYLNFPERHKVISVCGWIYAKGETLFSRDASQCLAYDGRYFEGIKEHGLKKDELSWINFGSFIGCPVLDPDGGIASILLVAKSRNNSLEPEDLEITILASQLIGRILDV